jgi:hypothetical protein
MLRSPVLAALPFALLLGTVVLAAPLGGSQPAVCSALQVLSCDAGSDCDPVTVEK